MINKIKNLLSVFPIFCIFASLSVLFSGAVSSESAIITLFGVVWLACLVGGLFDE